MWQLRRRIAHALILECDENSVQECVPLTISYHLYFLRISKVWSMLHHGSVGAGSEQRMLLYVYIYFFGIFLLCFHQEISVFSMFIPFFFVIKNFFSFFKILLIQKKQLNVWQTIQTTIPIKLLLFCY